MSAGMLLHTHHPTHLSLVCKGDHTRTAAVGMHTSSTHIPSNKCYYAFTTHRNLVRQHYPWFLRLYDALPKPIMRADAARYLYMHKYGGLYSDLDIEAVSPFDFVLTTVPNASVLLAYMGTDYKYPHNIPNAFMASKPGYVDVKCSG